MAKKKFGDLNDEEKKSLGKKFARCSGADGFTIFLYVCIGLALCFSIPLGIFGILWRDDKGMLIMGILGCAFTPILIGSIFLVKVWRGHRLEKNETKLNELLKQYDKDTLVECRKFWRMNHWLYGMFAYYGSEPSSASARALQNAAINAAFGHSSNYTPSSGSSSASSETVRVKLKNGKELHTEERFGDYKTYLYDEDGKNTGLHIQGDKVYDDNWKEQGSFDSTGKFNPKN